MKTILITGSTDGIGLETAKQLISMGHRVLLHGRSPEKLEAAEKALFKRGGDGRVESYRADLSRMTDVVKLANAVIENQPSLTVLINNAGVYNAPNPTTPDGLDVRFAVNTIAPYFLTQRLSGLLGSSGRVINVSSAAQSPVQLPALSGASHLSDGEAYAQSKLAITMWSVALARSFGTAGPAIVAVNPGSLLGSKMVEQAFGIAGKDLGIGAGILTRAALEKEFHAASGQYFDNDEGRFCAPHPHALDPRRAQEVIRTIEDILGRLIH